MGHISRSSAHISLSPISSRTVQLCPEGHFGPSLTLMFLTPSSNLRDQTCVFLPLCSSLTKPPYGAIDNMGPMNWSSLFSTHYRYFRTHLVCWVLRQNVLSLGQRAEKESKNHQNLHCNKGDPRESPAMHPLFSLQNP